MDVVLLVMKIDSPAIENVSMRYDPQVGKDEVMLSHRVI